MKYFLVDRFENNDGTIGNVNMVFDDINVARMEYHSRLASHYIPDNMKNTKWFFVGISGQTGITYDRDYFTNERDINS